MKTFTCENCSKQFTDGGIVFKMDDHDAALCEECAEIIKQKVLEELKSEVKLMQETKDKMKRD